MAEFSPTRYDSMQYRKCGKWGLKLPAISLGAWETFGGYKGEQTARECLFRAFDLGITHFDLANNYGKPPGHAEQVVGKILKEMPRDELIISSKAGYTMWPGPYGDFGSRKYIIASCDQSLKRLGLDYVDIFYHHRPDPETPLEESLGALESIVRSGKALYAGISNYQGPRAAEAAELMQKRGWAPITIHQPRYNMFDRWIEDGLLPVAKKEGFGLIPFSPLACGLLTDKYLNGIPEGSRATSDMWSAGGVRDKANNAEFVEKIRGLNAIAQERGQSLAQMALAWVLRHPEVTSALIGASSVKQIEDNVAALKNLAFSKEELLKIEKLI
ncbi:L-glyceraldehyde 3-phosphate reductase [Verrucomicrobium sp. GAS474]|uniref:aldo/keto reductase n=1 Tax=Verrucomicrobium sp. GAS474 TaxID=1882831 RepID=UPI00087B7128|nr:aldo/keto reductase [Verrucomicrobium sp. GAS474]SDU11060.1 L-glyceraldehyde 3-phosphate reductase [Verrucomicrobium sp. GAS474]